MLATRLGFIFVYASVTGWVVPEPTTARYVVQDVGVSWAGQTHLNSDAKIADEGHPQGATNCLLFSAKKPASSRQRRMEFAIAHYDLHSSRRYALRRAPTRDAPTNCLLFPAKKPASSCQRRREFAIAHYGLHSSRRYALRRAPTRGAPTRFRQPHVGLSQFDAIALVSWVVTVSDGSLCCFGPGGCLGRRG